MRIKQRKTVCGALFGLAMLATVVGVSMVKTEAAAADAVEYYNFGSATEQATRLEAEAHVDNPKSGDIVTPSSANKSFSSGGFAAMDYGESSTYTINVEKEGDYVVKYAYFTYYTPDNSLSVEVNGGGAVSMGNNKLNMTTNSDANHHFPAYFGNYDSIHLNQGENTIKISVQVQHAWIKLDFIELYQKDAVYYYPIEMQQLGKQNVGEIIEAEFGVPTSAKAHTADQGPMVSINEKKEIVTGDSFSGGYCVRWLNSSNSDDKMQYLVHADKAGTYYMEVSTYGTSSKVTSSVTDAYQMWTINGKEPQKISYSYEKYDGFSKGMYGVVDRYEVELQEGQNTIVIDNNRSTCTEIHIDWFRFYEKPEGSLLGKIVEAEDYALGAVLATRKPQASYPVVSGNVVELHGTRTAEISFTVATEKEGYYDLYVRGFTGSTTAGFLLSINDGEPVRYASANTGWLTGTYVTVKDMVWRIRLNEGDNTLKFTRSSVGGSYDFTDLDWFCVTEEKITPNAGEEIHLNYGESIDISEPTATLEDPTIAAIEEGKLVAKKGGETTLIVPITYENEYSYQRTYQLVVNKIAYTGEDLTAADETLPYNGEEQIYNGTGTAATAPAGWTIGYPNGRGATTLPGSASVTVLFTHDGYLDVRKDVTFAVVRAQYSGNELIAEDVKGFYDRETQYSVSAQAPEDWTISYENNGRVQPGENEVTVTFTHPGYEDVVKQATLQVVYAAEAKSASVSLEGDIALNFRFAVADEVIAQDPTAKVVFDFGGEKTDIALSTLTAGADGLYKVPFAVAAKDYASPIGAVVETTLGWTYPVEYSVAQYLQALLESEEEEYAAAKPLAQALLDYCETAAAYFGEETIEPTEAMPDLTAYETQTEGEQEGVTFSSVSVKLLSETSLRIYFKAADIEGLTFRIDGETVSATQKGEYYYLELTGIAAGKFAETHTFEIGSLRVTTSVLAYGAWALVQDTDVSLKEVIKTLCDLNTAATQYFAANEEE